MVKCLVVDDDVLGREFTLLYLEGIADCVTADNGLEAVEMFRTAFEEGKPFDLILLDLVMPEMDGNTAATKIRQIEKEWGVSVNDGVKIIVISSLNTPNDIMQSYVSAKSAAHLVKPIKPDKLITAMSKLGLIKL